MRSQLGLASSRALSSVVSWPRLGLGGLALAGEREDGWDITWAYDAPWDAYHGALGRLVQQFGQTEVHLHKVLKSIIFDFTSAEANPLNWEILEALTGPMRVAGLRDNIKRILRVAEVEETIMEGFEYALKHLGEIHFFRDRVVHHGGEGSSHEPGKFYTSNDMTSREMDQQDILVFDPEMMLDMAYDLKQIREYLSCLEDDAFSWFHHKDQAVPCAPDQRPTWRYKPSLLVKTGPKHWPKFPKRRRQQGPYPAKPPPLSGTD